MLDFIRLHWQAASRTYSHYCFACYVINRSFGFELHRYEYILLNWGKCLIYLHD
jgi:hypothetical protein